MSGLENKNKFFNFRTVVGVIKTIMVHVTYISKTKTIKLNSWYFLYIIVKNQNLSQKHIFDIFTFDLQNKTFLI